MAGNKMEAVFSLRLLKPLPHRLTVTPGCCSAASDGRTLPHVSPSPSLFPPSEADVFPPSLRDVFSFNVCLYPVQALFPGKLGRWKLLSKMARPGSFQTSHSFHCDMSAWKKRRHRGLFFVYLCVCVFFFVTGKFDPFTVIMRTNMLGLISTILLYIFCLFLLIPLCISFEEIDQV